MVVGGESSGGISGGGSTLFPAGHGSFGAPARRGLKRCKVIVPIVMRFSVKFKHLLSLIMSLPGSF